MHWREKRPLGGSGRGTLNKRQRLLSFGDFFFLAAAVEKNGRRKKAKSESGISEQQHRPLQPFNISGPSTHLLLLLLLLPHRSCGVPYLRPAGEKNFPGASAVARSPHSPYRACHRADRIRQAVWRRQMGAGHADKQLAASAAGIGTTWAAVIGSAPFQSRYTATPSVPQVSTLSWCCVVYFTQTHHCASSTHCPLTPCPGPPSNGSLQGNPRDGRRKRCSTDAGWKPPPPRASAGPGSDKWRVPASCDDGGTSLPPAQLAEQRCWRDMHGRAHRRAGWRCQQDTPCGRRRSGFSGGTGRVCWGRSASTSTSMAVTRVLPFRLIVSSSRVIFLFRFSTSGENSGIYTSLHSVRAQTHGSSAARA